MKQTPFEAAHEREWAEFEMFVEQGRGFDPAEMPARFRRLCQALALAAQRCYSTDLVDRLNRLALRGHHALYANRRRESQAVLDFGDMMILGMAFPNLIGVVLLSDVVRSALDGYWKRLKAGEFPRR